MHELNIDPEFEWLHIPMDEKKRQSLKEDLVRHGAGRAILVWNGIILDGHKRYRICRANHIPFRVRSISLPGRKEAMEWICIRNLLRQDLPEGYWRYNVGKRFNLRHEIDLAEADGNGQVKVPRRKYLLAKQVGDMLKLSESTVIKYSQYAEAIDALRCREPVIAERLLSGQVKAAHEVVMELSQLPAEELRILRDNFSKEGRGRLMSSEIWHELQWSRIYPPSVKKKKPARQDAAIKQMPAYDPDAEISSLSLTIPTWISSIERVKNTCSLPATTKPARSRLLSRLSGLAEAAASLSVSIKEAEDE